MKSGANKALRDNIMKALPYEHLNAANYLRLSDSHILDDFNGLFSEIWYYQKYFYNFLFHQGLSPLQAVRHWFI